MRTLQPPSCSGIIMRLLRTESDELKSVEDRLAAEGRKVYSEIFEPYIKLFTQADSGRLARLGSTVTSQRVV